MTLHIATGTDTDHEPVSLAPYTVGFSVYTNDFRQALSSVVGHALQKPDLPSINRVRMVPGPVNMEVFATDRVTAALAIVSVVTHERASDTHLRVTDASGLFDGRSVTLVRDPLDENMPNIPALFAAMIRREPGIPPALATNGSSLALFKHATAAYKEPLILEAAATDRAALLLSCGDSFLGALMPVPMDDEKLAQAAQWRRDWEQRLQAPARGAR